ncbi:MAG: polyhydroxyalkanoate synthesis regulator DNA-binding domain-containing protein [Anaerolineaceae bacterium]|nr:polyhydroxyalkanoate synthesis regulator DNA-binding domain-containing protein [Anaerolineaceae bacterium]
MIIIRRYANRKLYNTHTRKYIKLDDVALLVQSNENIQVLSHPEGEDITAMILSQIILEQEKGHGGVLPKKVLTRIVQAGDLALFKFRNSWKVFLEPENQFERELRKRVTILVDDQIISETNAEELLSNILDERFHEVEELIEDEIVNDAVPLSVLDQIKTQLDTLEGELKQLSNDEEK